MLGSRNERELKRFYSTKRTGNRDATFVKIKEEMEALHPSK